MKKESQQEAGIVGLFVAGAVVGAALAFLLAPESGSESRKRIGHWLHDHRGTGQDLFVKVKQMWAATHNGAHAADGIGDRRHGGAV
jgi:gas vesicle protein